MDYTLENYKGPFRSGSFDQAGISIDNGNDGEATVAVQLQAGTEVAAGMLNSFAYISSDAHGDALYTPNGVGVFDMSLNSGSTLMAVTGGYFVTSGDDGYLEFLFTSDSDEDFYLVVVMPDGRLVVSDIISIAAP